MQRRNTERVTHKLVHEFMETCSMFDLQGLLMGEDNNFTVAVEAFTFNKGEDILPLRNKIFSEDHWKSILTFTRELGIPFSLFMHQNGTQTIHRYDISRQSFESKEIIDDNRMSEQEFVSWWREHKKTVQTKPYRSAMEERIKDSYFDALLEANGLKWGGNIDAFVTVIADDYKPKAIIENRVTTLTPFSSYDPAAHYHKDVMTWKPLFLVAKKLRLPLFLCTYSVRKGEDGKIGIAEIDTRETKSLVYIGDPPCLNAFSSKVEAKGWLFDAISKEEGR